MPRDKNSIDTGKNFKVLHHMVGPWPRDHVLTYDELKDYSKDVDVERLLALEAIEPTDDEPTGVVPPGPENRNFLVDSAGRVIDSPGNDRPDVIARLGEKSRRMIREDLDEAREKSDKGRTAEDPTPDNRAQGEYQPDELEQGEPEGEDADVDYSTLRVADLRTDAEGRGISNAGSMNKAELVAALKKHDRDNAAD